MLKEDKASLEKEFEAIEKEITANLTLDDIAEINDTLETLKAETVTDLVKRNKLATNLMILSVLIVFALFSGIVINLIFCIPLAGIFIYNAVKVYKLARKINLNDIIIGSLLHTKEEYLQIYS